MAALNIKDGARKRAILLYQVGEATQSILDTLSEMGDNYDTVLAKLDEYFTPKKNVHFEIFKFRLPIKRQERLLTSTLLNFAS